MAQNPASIGIGTYGDNHNFVAKGQASNFDHNIPLVVEDTQLERIEGYVNPTGGVSGNGPYEFILPAVNDAYLMLGNMALYVKAQVYNADGTILGANDNVAPVNCFGTALWEHTEVLLNDYSVGSSSASNTHYKGVIETLLSYDATTKESHLKAQIFEMDQPGKFDNMKAATEADHNTGHTNRAKIVALSKEFDLMTPLTADFLRTDKHLAPGNKLAIKLYKAKNAFVLNTSKDAADYVVVIKELKLYYQRIRLREKFPVPRTERYLYTKTDLKRFPIPQGMTSYSINLHQGVKMPKSIIVAQVLTSASEGTYKENPFYFKNFNLNYLCLKVNGMRVPSEPLRPKFSAAGQTNSLVAREYINMFMNTGLFRIDRGNCVTYEAFKDGLTIFPFDLNIDMCNGYHLHTAKDGSITIDLGWGGALAKPITVLVHCSYDEVLTRKVNDGGLFETVII